MDIPQLAGDLGATARLLRRMLSQDMPVTVVEVEVENGLL